MAHPTETIMQAIKSGLENSVDDLDNVFWPNQPIHEDELPCCIIGTAGEEIQPYHNKFYIVNLSIQVKYHFLHDGLDNIGDMLTMINASDAIIKALQGSLQILEVSASRLDKSINLEKTVFTMSKNYNFRYKRTRGLI